MFATVMSSLAVVALAIFVSQMAQQLDEELNACGTGVFKNGKCECVNPYTGKHCELVNCGYGEIIDSQFLVDSITTPEYENGNKVVPGCKCDSKFWGYNCDQCTSKNINDCTGFCKDNYYGARCDILCKLSVSVPSEDVQGLSHAEAGGVFNYYKENPGGEPYGLCQYDGSVKCREGRAGKHCEFPCAACEYGSCNLDDGTCDCFDGYYGDLCDKTCPGRCSGKNGVCQADGKCKCEPGFTGDDCSLECCVRDFGTDIGRVHGKCNPLGGCDCDSGWSGPECDCNAEVTCSGRGSCSDGDCVCEPQFQGARCEMCNDTRIGPFCQYDRFQCPDAQTLNGEFVAVNSHGDYACKCKAGFTGDNCERCLDSAYPKSGPNMCTLIVPASLCGRGTVKPEFEGDGIMCDCEAGFSSETDCENCIPHHYGPDCDVICDDELECTNSGGECVNSPPGCLCPPGKTNVNGICSVCGGDSECVHGQCFRGRCECDPGYYGDDCSVSAAVFNDKVCNGFTPILKFETATCETATDCTDIEGDSMENRQVAYRAQQFGREMFCHRLDTPLALKDQIGCCVDSDSNGKCDADMLADTVCSEGEMVTDICNERVLEGELNVFEWCLSQELNCTVNGECVDPDLCENRCDLGLNASDWVERWERDHIESMETLMNETWKFPIHFPDPYTFRHKYAGTDIDDVCQSGVDYRVCRDHLIPNAQVYNLTKMYTEKWVDMPSYKTCKFGRYVHANDVNGTKTVQLEEPIWAGRIELISDPTRTAVYARYGSDEQAYPNASGDAHAWIDSVTFYGKGNAEAVIYNYTTPECADLIRKSAYEFPYCEQLTFHELDYDWNPFCEWRNTVSLEGGFEQRCYEQSKVCGGCEFYQEGCVGLPLFSEHEAPMPFPCNNYWEGFCDVYLNETAKPTGYCAYSECECEGYAVGGAACNLQCPVPQFTGTEAPCGEDMDPPWGKCEPHIGAIAFGFEQGECDCYNGGSPSVGCAQVCEGEQDCSPDVDTPYSVLAFNCSEIADVVSVEVISDTEQRCHINLRDSVCNYWRGRCECATPYTAFTKLEQPLYYNEGSYRIALMQGYEIDEYAPFIKYVEPAQSNIRLMKLNRLCADEFTYPDEDSLVCLEDGIKFKNTDWTTDNDGRRCKDYTAEDCEVTVYEIKTSGYCDEYITTAEECEAARIALGYTNPVYTGTWTVYPQGCKVSSRETLFSTIGTAECGHAYDCICKEPARTQQRFSKNFFSDVACEENKQYELEDMTKDECFSFRSFESGTSLSNGDASDYFGENSLRADSFRVYDFGNVERVYKIEVSRIIRYGTCDAYITSAEECEAVALGDPGLTIVNSASFPRGCWLNANDVYFNTDTSNPSCTSTRNCICKTNTQVIVEKTTASSLSQAYAKQNWNFVDIVSGTSLVDIETQYLRVRGASYDITIKPLLTSVDLVISDTKQGCIKDDNDLTYYDFKPNVYTTEPVECSYTYKTDGVCDVRYSKGMLSVKECAEACREDERVAFTMVSGECMCAGDTCDDFATTGGEIYTITGNDACGYKYRFKGSCTTSVEKTPYFVKDSGTCDLPITTEEECEAAVAALGYGFVDSRSLANHPKGCITGGASYFNTAGVEDCTAQNYACICKDLERDDIKSCRDACLEYDTFSFSPCQCHSGCTKGGTTDLYSVQKGFTSNDFVKVRAKSCEHFGHKTIEDIETCERASLILQEERPTSIEVYFLKTSGTCDEYITTMEECEAAHNALGISGPFYTGSYSSHVPPNCWTAAGFGTAWNTQKGAFGECGAGGMNCICKNPQQAQGCNVGVFFPEATGYPCTNCICYKGQGGYVSDYVEIRSNTCEDYGYYQIDDMFVCLEALAEFGHDISGVHANYFTSAATYTDIPAGCVVHSSRIYNPSSSAKCDTAPCICSKRQIEGTNEATSDRYVIKTSGKCTDDMFEVTSKEECLAAAGILGVLKDQDPENIFTNYVSNTVCGVWNKYVHFGEGLGDCNEQSRCICRVNPPITLLVAGTCESQDMSSYSKEECEAYASTQVTQYVEYETKTSGTCDEYITTAEECEAAKTELGANVQDVVTTNSADYPRGCWISNSNAYFNEDTSNANCQTTRHCICKNPITPNFKLIQEGSMPKGKCLYVDGMYMYAEGTNDKQCNERVPCVCQAKSDASLGSCPNGESRPYKNQLLCYPTSTRSSTAQRDIEIESQEASYVFEEIGDGMCAPDHDHAFHNRKNPYRVSDEKEIPDLESCKQECLNTEGCTGFSFSDKPTYNFREYRYVDDRIVINGNAVPHYLNTDVLGDGVKIDSPISALDCMQHCEENTNRANIGYVPGEWAGAGTWQWGQGANDKRQCSCYGPKVGMGYKIVTAPSSLYSANFDQRMFEYTVSETTCVLSSNECDKPVLLGDGKCSVGVDYWDKTLDECEQLCIDDNFCRTFSWRPGGMCRVSGRDCHYKHKYNRVGSVNDGDEALPASTYEEDYVLSDQNCDDIGADYIYDIQECYMALTLLSKEFSTKTQGINRYCTNHNGGSDYTAVGTNPDEAVTRCMERCRSEGFSGFFIHRTNMPPQIGCACSTDGCESLSDAHACCDAYKIVKPKVNAWPGRIFPAPVAATNPQGCYLATNNIAYVSPYSDIPRNANGGKKSACKRGWKRYSLGHTNLPGTRYRLTRKVHDTSPFFMAAPLRDGQEYVYQKISDYEVIYAYNLRVFEGFAADNPGGSSTGAFPMKVKWCAEACQKLSYNSHIPCSTCGAPYGATQKLKTQKLIADDVGLTNDGFGMTGFIIKPADGRCYCEDSFGRDDMSLPSKRNFGNYFDSPGSSSYRTFQFEAVDVEFVRRHEFSALGTACLPSKVGGSSIIPHETYAEFIKPGNSDDPTGRARACGLKCKEEGMLSFQVDVLTGHCTCYSYPWDACGQEESTSLGGNHPTFKSALEHTVAAYCKDSGHVYSGVGGDEETAIKNCNARCVGETTDAFFIHYTHPTWTPNLGCACCYSGWNVQTGASHTNLYHTSAKQVYEIIAPKKFENMNYGEGRYCDGAENPIQLDGTNWQKQQECFNTCSDYPGFLLANSYCRCQTDIDCDPPGLTEIITYGNIVRTSGTCDEYITTAEECRAAHNALGVSGPFYTGSYSSHVPPNCWTAAGFGTAWNTQKQALGECGAGGMNCICKSQDIIALQCPSTTMMKGVSLGRCVSFCKQHSCTHLSYNTQECRVSTSACSEASDIPSTKVYAVSTQDNYEQFKILREEPNRTPRHMGVPLKVISGMNTHTGYRDCSVKFVLIQEQSCSALDGQDLNSQEECTEALEDLSLFEIKESGSCNEYITSLAECQAAAVAMGFSDTNVNSEYSQFLTKGCFTSGNKVLFNSYSSTQSCGISGHCICKGTSAEQVNNAGDPVGCFWDTDQRKGYYNEQGLERPTSTKQRICRVPDLPLSKSQCETYAEEVGLPFESEYIEEFDSVCVNTGSTVKFTPYAEGGICLKNSFPISVDAYDTYKYEEFTDGGCMTKKCEGVTVTMTRQPRACAYMEYPHSSLVDPRLKPTLPLTHQGCVDLCVDFMLQGKLGQVNTGVHKMIVIREREIDGKREAKGLWDTDDDFLSSDCKCLPLKESRFCDENAARPIKDANHFMSNEIRGFPSYMDGGYRSADQDYGTLSVTVNIKCNYAQAFNSYEALHRSVITDEEATDICFKACTSGSMFHAGSDASVGNMNINGFRVDLGVKFRRGVCECITIPETPEQCETQGHGFEWIGNNKELYNQARQDSSRSWTLLECENSCAETDCMAYSVKNMGGASWFGGCFHTTYENLMGSGEPVSRYTTYMKENFKTFRISVAGSEKLTSVYTIDTTFGDGSPVSFPRDVFIPQEKKEWYTHLDFTKYSIQENCVGKAPIFDDECTEAISLFPEWQKTGCHTGFTNDDDICYKLEKTENAHCEQLYTSDDNILYNISFTGTSYNDHYIVDGSEDPRIEVCETFNLIKTFASHPLSIEGQGVLMENVLSQSITLAPGEYTYSCASHPEMTGTLIVNDCNPEVIFMEPSAYPVRYEIKTSGTCDEYITTAEECEAAAVALGLSDTTVSVRTDRGNSNNPPYCNFVDGAYLLFNNPPGTGACTGDKNCVCKKTIDADACGAACSELYATGQLGSAAKLREVATHYASFSDKCKCHFTYSRCETSAPLQGSTYITIQTTEVNDCVNEDEMICKESPDEKSEDEMYMCMSETDIKVFDSGENCVICGGGVGFEIGSVFFNENGDSLTCRYGEETQVCEDIQPGWSQYQVLPNFEQYKEVEKGYCENYLDLELDFSEMILEQMIEECATGCKAYDRYNAFSLSRTFCYCTSSQCDNRIGGSSTFELINQEDIVTYTEGDGTAGGENGTVGGGSDAPDAVDSGYTDIIQRWNTNGPGLRCFKDLEHTDETPCDWIRALKHFARGGSYRIGDCHNLAPGTTDQIPCNGHGFASAGTCACDYAENFELRSSGVGLTFEAPNLRQTPFRGKACEFMCPGYDMFNMESVCSGHGRCETDGRCACEQGFTGYNCHLACEASIKALTCSGHGVCNERSQPVRYDIGQQFEQLSCHNETLYLSRDRVIRMDDTVLYMYKSIDGLSIDTFTIPSDTIVDFRSANESYKVSINGAEDADNPTIRTCRTFTIVKSFAGSPLTVQTATGESLVYNWDSTQQSKITAEPGTYTYFSLTEPNTMKGILIVSDCRAKSTRVATLDDFYLKGTAVRLPYNSVSDYPHMPCADRLNITREAAYHPKIEHTTQNVTIECSVLPGYTGEAYGIICGSCQCEDSTATGSWSGHDCRTPALGFLGKDARDTCPGMTGDKKPCNGGGSCNWGSLDGLGQTTYVDSQCFCGDTSIHASFATAPRNQEGAMMFHVMDFDTPLYVDFVNTVDGNGTECLRGTVPLNFQECEEDWVSDGGIETIISEAAIVSDVRNEVVFDFDGSCLSEGTFIDQISTEDPLLSGSKSEQKMQCAGACFGEYKFSFDGRCPEGGVIVLNEDTNTGNTWDEKAEQCAYACRAKITPIDGDWTFKTNPGFSIRQNGECICDETLSSCPKIISGEWKRFDFVIPYTFIRSGSCPGLEASVGTPAGESDSDRRNWCGSMCQGFTFDRNTVASGFLYTPSDPDSCICQALSSDCPSLSDGRDRYDFTHYSGFTLEYDNMCKCEVDDECEVGAVDSRRFKILGEITPMSYTLEQRVSDFEGDFICVKDSTVQCKAGALELLNYNPSDCSCKFGFTGDTCEIARMMCIFGGVEEDGTSCTCTLADGSIDQRRSSKGCCTKGLYWDQIRYSSFSPLVDFDVIPENIFYYDALKSVCKPGPSKFKKVSEGADAVRIHNYAATTTEISLERPTPCSFQLEEPLYKAVYKYGAGVSGTPTITITKDEIRALKYQFDSQTDTFIHEYAKDRCLYRCTHKLSEEPVFKSFHLKKTLSEVSQSPIVAPDFSNLVYVYDTKPNPGMDLEEKIQFCRSACFRGVPGQTSQQTNIEFFNEGRTVTHFGLLTSSKTMCACHSDEGSENTPYNTGVWYDIHPDISYDCTCMSEPAFVSANKFVRPTETDDSVYDIVYPRDKVAESQNLECFQADYVRKHIDINRKTTFDEMTGSPWSIKPQTLKVKKHLGQQQVNSFYDCAKTCDGQAEANSFLWGRPQIPIVFGGKPLDPFKRLGHCWGHCSSDGDCETGLSCVEREATGSTELQGLLRYCWNHKGGSDYTAVGTDPDEAVTRCEERCRSEGFSGFFIHRTVMPPQIGCACSTDGCETLSSPNGCCDAYKIVAPKVNAWPGCIEPDHLDQLWGSGDTIDNSVKICYDTSYLNDRCFCTVSDQNLPECTRTYTRLGSGYCVDQEYLQAGQYPDLLEETNDLYNPDRVHECMNRCLDENPEAKAFFTKLVNGDQRCACASTYCAERSGSSTFTSYTISACDQEQDGYLLEEHTDTLKIIQEFTILTDDAEYIGVSPNPFTCGIGTILNQGDIVRKDCMCPITSYEKLYETYDYVRIGTGDCDTFKQLSASLSACENACDDHEDCNSFSHSGSTCKLSTRCRNDWIINEMVPYMCYHNSRAEVASATSLEACAVNAGTRNFAYNQESRNCYSYSVDLNSGEECDTTESLHTPEPTSYSEVYTFRYSITEILKGKPRNDFYYGDLTGRTYTIIREPGYSTSGSNRYAKEVDSNSQNRYCTKGEFEIYEADTSALEANDHTCMQRCGEQGLVVARGQTLGDVFSCKCSDYAYTEAECPANMETGGTQYRVVRETSDTCTCPGFYLKDGDAVSCPPGRFSGPNDPCMDSCSLCAEGRFSETGFSECESCPAGKIQTGVRCEDCPSGQFSPSGDNECYICNLGLFTQVKGTGTCTDCPNGYYDDDPVEGKTCKICPKGTRSGLATQMVCGDCETGKYGDQTGMASCKECSPGYYQPIEGQTSSSSCQVCQKGKYQNQYGKPSCKNCGVGYYTDQTGKTGCKGCAVAKYQNQNGQSSCKNCPTGQYQDQVSKNGCKACAKGKYNDQNARTSCKNCAKGRYGDQTGRTASSQCKTCPTGRYEPSTGSTGCDSCGTLRGGYTWSNSPDRVTKERSCDMYSRTTNWDSMYKDWGRACDAGKASQQWSGYGDRYRRVCWAGGYDDCNDFAGRFNGDWSKSWTKKKPSGYNYYFFCLPSTANQYD